MGICKLLFPVNLHQGITHSIHVAVVLSHMDYFIPTLVFEALCTPASILKEQHNLYHRCGSQKGCKRKHISYVVVIVIVIISD